MSGEGNKVSLKILCIIESKDAFKTTKDIGGNLPPKGLPVTCVSCYSCAYVVPSIVRKADPCNQ